MAKLVVLAGDYPKGHADFDSSGITFLKSGKLPKSAYFIDIETYAEDGDGTVEIRFFDGRKVLVEHNKAFMKALKAAMFDEPGDIEMRRQRWQERQAKGGTKVKKPITVGKIILWLFVGFVVLGLLGNCVNKPGTATHAYVEEHKSQQAESKVSQDLLNFQYTKQAYPKLYRQWGNVGVEKINQLMPKAALHVAREKSCDRVETVELSDNRSKPKEKIVFFVDCANKKRFFVSEADIYAGSSVNAEQDKKIDNKTAFKVCDDGIKANLQHPSTFKLHITGTGVMVNPNGNIIVARGFSAKNGLGMEVEYSAICTLDKDYNLDPQDVHIEQK